MAARHRWDPAENSQGSRVKGWANIRGRLYATVPTREEPGLFIGKNGCTRCGPCAIYRAASVITTTARTRRRITYPIFSATCSARSASHLLVSDAAGMREKLAVRPGKTAVFAVLHFSARRRCGVTTLGTAVRRGRGIASLIAYFEHATDRLRHSPAMSQSDA